ncbi:lmo0937 family membrane protein [Pseudarthrobacter enclensis]|uniref:Membrane protein n=1 Tax=Pseudarthrobacter enclensis TaxID=993070 RepID=A0ABT9RQN4_9MICC|nr:lmo0937 family membrane protein [Pseudarthrobacter enclensis]MDP9887542.1 putative membrane protein [Pseudarthrobacter enclensis]
MLLWIAIIIAVLWLLGLLANIGGGLIHILLVVAVIVLIFHFVTARRRV